MNLEKDGQGVDVDVERRTELREEEDDRWVREGRGEGDSARGGEGDKLA